MNYNKYSVNSIYFIAPSQQTKGDGQKNNSKRNKNNENFKDFFDGAHESLQENNNQNNPPSKYDF
ncbi:hypothetical protein [Lachnobacterium bovis]|uniref:Uncharacterized protein n=1 Tax=Lachnobacterium bovis TaxID=140626 RepID=A0A1H9R8G8_9FIRM|nr:hypothetical protein [Lachnobacterium bovis]SER68349.1 hypothetical protein SAMN02910429_00796 [Lachnobacterium bovis]